MAWLREKDNLRFVLVTFGLVVAMAVLDMFVVGPTMQAASEDASAAEAAAAQAARVAADTYESVAPNWVALTQKEAEPSINKLLADRQRRIDTLTARRDQLAEAIVFRPSPRFQLPPAPDEVTDTWYRTQVNNFVRRMNTQFEDSAAYLFVKDPALESSRMRENIETEEYVKQAAAWARLVRPAGGTEEANPRRRRGNTGANTPVGNAPIDPIELEKARASMTLLLLNILQKAVDAGRGNDSPNLTDIGFVAANDGVDLIRRFGVSVSEPSYYRPIVLRVTLEATESQLARYLDRVVDPEMDGAEQQPLTIHRINVAGPEDALSAEAVAPVTTVTIDLVAWQLDLEESPAGGGSNQSDGARNRYALYG